MNWLRLLGFSLVVGCLTTVASSATEPYNVLRARAKRPLQLYIGSAKRRALNPFFYSRRNLWEREASQFDQRNQAPALFGKEFDLAAGDLTFHFEPTLIPATSDDDFYSGLNFVWGNRLGLDWDLGGRTRLTVRERAYLYSHKQAGAGWVDGYYANPLFENLVTATLEFPLGSNGVVGRIPLHLQQRLYGDCEGARYSGQLRNWLWMAPEVSFPMGRGAELAVSYTTDTFVSSRTGNWYVIDGWLEGVAELTYRVKL